MRDAGETTGSPKDQRIEHCLLKRGFMSDLITASLSYCHAFLQNIEVAACAGKNGAKDGLPQSTAPNSFPLLIFPDGKIVSHINVRHHSWPR